MVSRAVNMQPMDMCGIVYTFMCTSALRLTISTPYGVCSSSHNAILLHLDEVSSRESCWNRPSTKPHPWGSPGQGAEERLI